MRLLLLIALLLLPGSPRLGAEAEGADPQALVGTWTVDLRPTPDAAPYTQEMVILSVEGDSIQGTFYGSAITRSHLNTDWGAVRFAFVTTDGGGGVYHHSGRLEADRIEGLSHALDRGFLLPWRATRAEP